MKGFLEYVPGNSFLHRLNPVAKLAASLLIIFACFLTKSFILLGLILVLDLVLAANCGMMRQTLGLAKVVAGFSLLLALIALFTTPEGAQLVALPWGYIGTGSILAALRIILRLVACAVPLFLVFYVTKLNDIANSLVKVCRAPYKYAFAFTTAIRFIPILARDMAAVIEAQTARGVELDGNFIKKLRLLLPLCVPLLVSSIRKIEAGAISAELRGFHLRGKKSA